MFVNLGIKGADKTVGALVSVKKGLGEVSSMSLEAKAAILAAVYGLERMMNVSAMAGTNITNLSTLTGVNTKTLQQWEYAMTQAGGSASEMDGVIKGLQNSLAQIALDKGVPEGLAMLAQKLPNGINFSKAMTDVDYLLKNVRQAVKNFGSGELPTAVANYLASSLNISPNMIAGIRRGVFDDKTLNSAPIRSDAMINALAKTDQAFARTKWSVEQLFDAFTAAHGQQLANDILKITTALFQLINALDKLAVKLHLFEGIEHVVGGTAMAIGDWGAIVSGKAAPEAVSQDKYKYMTPEQLERIRNAADPTGVGGRQSGSITSTVNVYGADPKDAKQAKTVHEKAVKQAYFGRPQPGGN